MICFQAADDLLPFEKMVNEFRNSQLKWNLVIYAAKKKGKSVKKLQLDCPTRWSSLFYSLQTTLEAWSFIQQAVRENGQFPLNFIVNF